MKEHEKISQALAEISDAHIDEAAEPRSAKRRVWLRITALAAIAALVIAIVQTQLPTEVSADMLVSQAGTCRASQMPNRVDYDSVEAYRADLDRWLIEWDQRSETVATALEQLSGFFTAGNTQFLTGDKENTAWSPINAYIGLAMAAELAAGNSRQQILELFGVDSIEALRSQTSTIWESTYTYEDGPEACTLANSLWLQQGLQFRQEAMDDLAYHYYASVYQTNLSKAGTAISNWLRKNTGGILKNYDVQLPDSAVMALYSTIYFQSRWTEAFAASANTEDVFHAPGGDKTVTYMNKSEVTLTYHYGAHFSAVALSLVNGSKMWLILPDDGYSPADVLAEGEYMDMLLHRRWENHKTVKVNLSMPKFDISGDSDLASGLRQMGLTDIFDTGKADLSAAFPQERVFFTAATQALRVQVDEEGIKAAAYFGLPGATSPVPPDEIIDFVLNRPFLFVISRSDIPLFTGVVANP